MDAPNVPDSSSSQPIAGETATPNIPPPPLTTAASDSSTAPTKISSLTIPPALLELRKKLQPYLSTPWGAGAAGGAVIGLIFIIVGLALSGSTVDMPLVGKETPIFMILGASVPLITLVVYLSILFFTGQAGTPRQEIIISLIVFSLVFVVLTAAVDPELKIGSMSNVGKFFVFGPIIGILPIMLFTAIVDAQQWIILAIAGIASTLILSILPLFAIIAIIYVLALISRFAGVGGDGAQSIPLTPDEIRAAMYKNGPVK